MVRLSPELIEDSYQYINPVKEYELSLRGNLNLILYYLGLFDNYLGIIRLQNWFD